MVRVIAKQEVAATSAKRTLPRVPLIHSFWLGALSVLVVLELNDLINMLTRAQWGDDLAIACVQNDLACREHHCLITGPGYLLAAALMFVCDTGIFDHGFDMPYLVIAAATVLGHPLEWRYRRATGSRYRLT